MCTCALIIAGITVLPARSTRTAPRGGLTSSLRPTAVMRPFSTTSAPASIGGAAAPRIGRAPSTKRLEDAVRGGCADNHTADARTAQQATSTRLSIANAPRSGWSSVRPERSQHMSISRSIAGIILALGLAAVRGGDPQQAPYVPKQSDRPEPINGDEAGFRSIFDGKTLAGWDGNPTYWRVENGALVGEIMPATVIKSNTFVVWRGGTPNDFELKLDYRITRDGNSGINYRSAIVADTVTPENRFAMRGYQCDLDGRKRYPGNNYEEKGRLFLAVRGQMTRVVGGRPPVLVSTLGDTDEVAPLVTDDWTAVHVIARGNVLTHIINNRVMTVVVDDDAPNRASEGLIGVQVHVGPPMKVEYRNIRLKNW